MAHLVARRLRRRADPRAAGDRLVSAAAARVVAGAAAWRRSGCWCARRGQRGGLRTSEPLDVPRVPGADLGGAALRAARRDARGGAGRRLRGLEQRPLHRAVLVRLDHPRRARVPALHRRGRADDVLPGGGRGRARGVRREPARVARPARRGGRRRAPADRAQPARRRPAAAVRARVRLGLAAEDAPAREDPRADRARRRASCRWRSRSCASSRTGSTRRCSTKLGLAGAIRSSPRARRCRSRWSAARACGSTTPPRRPRTTSIAEAVTNARLRPGVLDRGPRRRRAIACSRSTVADDGVGGADEQMGSGLQGLRDRVEAVGGTFELVSPRVTGRGWPPRSPR